MAEMQYLIGANTARGYEHFLGEIAPERGQVCVVRGPAGTGRHRLIAQVVETWEAAGRQVTRYLDPEDAGRLAAAVSGDGCILDGAAPHQVEAPSGAMLIDLGAALEGKAMDACRPEAADLHQRIRGLRLRAGRCLRAADAAWEDAAALYADAADAGSAYNLRLALSRWIAGAPGREQRVFAQAVTAAGVVDCLDGLNRENRRVLRLPWGCDPHRLLSPLTAALRAAGTGFLAARQPLNGGRLAHLCTATHALITETAEEGWDLKFDQPLLQREQQALRFDRAAWELGIHQAMEAMAQARQARDSLERLTADALNRDRREEMTARVLRYFR